MNDFLLECTDGDSLPETGSVDGGNSSSNKLGALSKREIEDFFRDTSSSSSSPSSSCPSSSSSSPAPGQQQQRHRHPNQRGGGWGAGEAGQTPSGEGGGSARRAAGEGEVVRGKKGHSRHGGSSGGGSGHHYHHHHSSGERLSPLPPHMRSLPKADQRCDGPGYVCFVLFLCLFFFFCAHPVKKVSPEE